MSNIRRTVQMAQEDGLGGDLAPVSRGLSAPVRGWTDSISGIDWTGMRALPAASSLDGFTAWNGAGLGLSLIAGCLVLLGISLGEPAIGLFSTGQDWTALLYVVVLRLASQAGRTLCYKQPFRVLQ
jgi:hypothetical protein